MATSSAEEVLRSLLAANTHVTTLVSTRIRPHIAAQADSLPYLTYERISTERFNNYAGADNLAGPLIQINGWSTSASQLASLRAAVRTTLNGVLNQTVSIGTNSANIRAIWLHDERDSFEPPRDGSDQATYGFEHDYKVFHYEALTL